ncbi:S-layer homology domain-containing protein [Pseudoflavonifractor phocaeensis]|uniref:S-layer homology domain-containing protein n=1 Tax=Pseudoflavonifractor phocaeensis TaxID=1870988 RepID=UPI001F3B7657|nr:S-layer homology domain-containing protein [Pseudoflavonifractor phocaeensis]MCF2597020.1 S-layer homology domain-containing protein [Pseudoflavonifractor phocaeensis]
MRNLKRALSLALASVMLLGMMVVGTSAAGYPDVDSKDNLEAIEVLKMVGIMTGDEKGNFNPDKMVTRNEMAVVMCNLLGLKTGGSHPFTDVPAWAAPYVAACYNNGIIAGVSATQFNGDANVTAVQAGLMVMKALGYFGYQGEFGDSWKLAVVKQADKIALYDGINAYTDQDMTRNDVAQLVLNALESDIRVVTEQGGMTVDGNGITVSVKPTYSYAYVAKKDGDYRGANGDEYQQLCEKLYGTKLKKVAVDGDDFGRPADKWTYGTESVLAPKAADATYTAEVSAKTIYADLALTAKVTATTYTNGKADSAIGTMALSKNDSKTKIGGNGVLVEAFKHEDKAGIVSVDIVVINTYVGEVNKVVAAKGDDEAYVNVSAKNGGVSGKYETEAFEKEDIVLYTVADGTIKSLKLAEKVEETEITKVTGTDSFVGDGVTYKYNKLAAKLTKSDVDSILDLYLDEYGYVIYTEVFKASSDYAYVLDAGWDTGRYGDEAYYAKLLLADGTVAEVEVDKDTLGDTSAARRAAIAAFEEDIVEYSKDSKDLYTLKSQAETAEKTDVKVTNGETKMTIDGETVYANAKTLFLLQKGEGSKATYTAYTGYANVPSLKATNTADVSVYCKSGNLATVVFIKDASVSESAKDIVYILATKDPTAVKDTDAGVYYTYKAVVNGEITTIDVDTAVAANLTSGNALFSAMVYDDYNIADISECDAYSKDSKDDNYVVEGTVNVAAEDDAIKVGSVYYALSADVEVYEVTTGDKIESATLSDVEKTATVELVINDGEVVTIFVIK